MNVDPEDLIPKLPKPRDLQPFPTTQSLVRWNCQPSELHLTVLFIVLCSKYTEAFILS